MDRIGLIGSVFDDLAEGTSERALDRCRDGVVALDPTALALSAIASFWIGSFTDATTLARRAVTASDDTTSYALGLAAASFAYAADPDFDGPSPLPLLVELIDAEASNQALPPEEWATLTFLAGEAALIAAQLSTARRLIEYAPVDPTWPCWSLAALSMISTARILAFTGEITAALAVLQTSTSTPSTGRLAVATAAVTDVVTANAALADDDLPTLGSAPSHGARDFIERGVLLLQAYAATASGRNDRAATLVLQAGGDEGLRACPLVDRALGLELLVAQALESGDAVAARGWGSAAAELADHPITAPTVDRIAGRILLAAGEVDAAVKRLERSVAACHQEGRAIEAAEGEILLAHSRIAGADVAAASRGLRHLVTAADRTGHQAARRAATEALRRTRRRLPPIAGGGWASLSSREAEVAHRVIAGEEITEIAAAMYLSPHTVKIHVSRVLCAFEVATRIGLLATAQPSLPPVTLPALTPRQSEIMTYVARGEPNTRIAQILGISERTVEKHIGDVLARWDLTTRFSIARAWWAQRPHPDPRSLALD
jgi:DNA-binding NarL/FixJ family response regulator